MKNPKCASYCTAWNYLVTQGQEEWGNVHYLTWKVLKQLHHSQPRKISSVTTGTCFPLFALTEVNITYHGKKSDYPCIMHHFWHVPHPCLYREFSWCNSWTVSVPALYFRDKQIKVSKWDAWQHVWKDGLDVWLGPEGAGADVVTRGVGVHCLGLWELSSV